VIKSRSLIEDRSRHLSGARYNSGTPLENADIDKSSDRAKGRTEDNIPRNNVSQMKEVVNYIQLAREHDGERSDSRAGGEILEDFLNTGFHAVCFRCDQQSSRITDSHLQSS